MAAVDEWQNLSLIAREHRGLSVHPPGGWNFWRDSLADLWAVLPRHPPSSRNNGLALVSVCGLSVPGNSCAQETIRIVGSLVLGVPLRAGDGVASLAHLFPERPSALLADEHHFLLLGYFSRYSWRGPLADSCHWNSRCRCQQRVEFQSSRFPFGRCGNDHDVAGCHRSPHLARGAPTYRRSGQANPETE